MRAGDLLRRLDGHLLPRLVAIAARLGQAPRRSRLLGGVALVCVLTVLLTAVWVTDRRPAGDLTVGAVTRVGVVDGDSVPAYLRATRGELDALLAGGSGPDTKPYALVALADYVHPQTLPAVVDGASVSAVLARVPLPDRQTEIVRLPAMRVPQDVVAGMAEVAERKDRQARDYRQRGAALTGDDARTRELRQLYDSGAQVAAQEAAAYRAGCSCVYAIVVRAHPIVLDRLAARPGVRAVDPAPEVSRLDRAVFTAPLPEQVDIVTPPPDTALVPADPGPSGAAASPAAGASSAAPPVAGASSAAPPAAGVMTAQPPPAEPSATGGQTPGAVGTSTGPAATGGAQPSSPAPSAGAQGEPSPGGSPSW